MATNRRGPGRLRCIGWSIALVAAVVLEAGVGAVLVLGLLLSPLGIGRVPARWALDRLRDLADLHRLWAARVMGVSIPRSYREPLPSGTTARLQAYRADPATWRDVRWLAADLTGGQLLAAIPGGGVFVTLLGCAYLADRWWLNVHPGHEAYPVGAFPPYDLPTDPGRQWIVLVVIVLAILGTCLLARPALRAYTWLQRWLLGPAPTERLVTRIAELTQSRASAVDTQAAEIRRIERDLHDGAQARLVSLGMSLGMAEKLLTANPEAAQQLLTEAKEATGLALSELRELVRGIHPPILADRGLAGAAQALALGCPIPVELSVELPGRAPAPVESALYFALTEVLTNLAKHSGATSAWIRLSYTDGRLGVMVGDDGRGGASMPEDGGLAGVARRLAGFDGMVHVASPIGGPTIVTMELPCQLAYALS
jgi:signal transduction histidine kinase